MTALIAVEDLEKQYHRGRDVVRAVDRLSLEVEEGEAVGVIGESGSGKSTLARCIAKLEQPTAGRVFFRGEDLTSAPDRHLTGFRREVQPVFQDPLAALNPRWNVRQLISEPLKVHDETRIPDRVAEALADVGLPENLLRRRTRDLSGGERQRVAIARAIVLRPSVLVLDEPTASIDMSMRRSLLALLKRLQVEHGLTYIYISHDIRTVEQICDRTVVMYRGRVVESGPTTAVLHSPGHVYTEVLASAVPRLGKTSVRTGLRVRERTVGDPGLPPRGCVFVDRCPKAMDICNEPPPSYEVSPGHWADCVLAKGSARAEEVESR